MERGEAPVVRGRGGNQILHCQIWSENIPKMTMDFLDVKSGIPNPTSKSDNVKSGKKWLGVSNSEAKIKPGLDNPDFL